MPQKHRSCICHCGYFKDFSFLWQITMKMKSEYFYEKHLEKFPNTFSTHAIGILFHFCCYEEMLGRSYRVKTFNLKCIELEHFEMTESCFQRITEIPVGRKKEHTRITRSPAPASTQYLPKSNPLSENAVQTLLELWQLGAMPTAVGSLFHAHCPLVQNLSLISRIFFFESEIYFHDEKGFWKKSKIELIKSSFKAERHGLKCNVNLLQLQLLLLGQLAAFWSCLLLFL